MTNITELENKIKEASHAYYDAEPIMSDQEFDLLVEQLREIDPTNPLLTKVGWGADEKDVSHQNDTELPIKIRVSLPKLQYTNKEGILKWIDDAQYLRISPKLDGMSVIVTYENGKRKSIISRGNGITGMELSSRLPVKYFPLELPNNVSATVRGEVFIYKNVFDDNLADDYANPRNATSGIVNSTSSDNKEFLAFLQHPQYDFIGLDTVYSEVIPDDVDKLSFIKDYYDKIMMSNIPCDGIVLDKFINDELFDSIAVKFPTVAQQTTVKSISWQVSSRGRLIPVVEFEPIKLYGTTVKRATGLHYSYIVDNQIGKGAIIEVTKANEIIPQIVKVIKPADDMTESLPEISYRLDGLHATLVLDTACAWERVLMRNFLGNYLSFTGFKGRSISTMIECIGLHTMKDFEDFISFVKTDGPELDHYLESSVPPSKILKVKELLNTKKVYTYQLLQMCGIDGIGGQQTEKLRGNKNLVEYLSNVNAVTDGLPLNRRVLKQLADGSIHPAMVTIYKGLLESGIMKPDEDEVRKVVVNTNPKVCLSGKFEGFTKAQLMEKFSDTWNLVDSLDKDCVYLVVPDLSRTSSKVTKAQKWGIKIIDFEEFKSLKGGENNV